MWNYTKNTPHQLLGGEAAEIVTIQPDRIKLQNTIAKKNPARPFVYCLYSHTFLPMASPDQASLITTESRQPQLTSHFALEIPAGRTALPCLAELNPQHSLPWDPGTPTLQHILLLLQPLIFPIFLSVPSSPYIINTNWGGGGREAILLLYIGKQRGLFLFFYRCCYYWERVCLEVFFKYRQVLTCTCVCS